MVRVIKKTMLSILIAGFMISVTSCNKNEIVTPGLAQFRLGANTTSTNTVTQTGRVNATNDLQFTSGIITFREVVFDGELESGNSVSITHEQIAIIDYATGVITPEIIIVVTAGTYRSVNLGIELQDDGSDPSMVLEGTYTNSNDVVIPIRFEFNSVEVFEANAQVVTLSTDTDVGGNITGDALDWFSEVTASELDAASQFNGTIVISETSNPDIFDIVADRLDVGTEAVFE